MTAAYSPPPTPTPPAKKRRAATKRRPIRLLSLTVWDLVRDPELATYLSERLAQGETVFALHGPPPISPVLIELGWETERGIDSGLVRALAKAGVPSLEVDLDDRRAQRRAAKAGCVAVFGATRLLKSSPAQSLGASLEQALIQLAPRAVVEVVIDQERLLARPGLEALSLDRAELEALAAGSRDPAPLLALRALAAGSALVRVGSPRSLRAGKATLVSERQKD